MAFVKLYGSILDSSVWSEDPFTRIVWITMLTMADAEGFVEAAVPGLARRANVPLEACETALERLQSPDPYSKSPEHDGRRIEKVDRGWEILNYKAYRELRTERQIEDAVRSKRYRERQSVTRHERPRTSEKDLSSLSVLSVSPLNVKEETAIVPRLPPNPLIAGRRPKMESDGYALIREIEKLEDRDPTEILMEAAGWKDRQGQIRTKVRLETMNDDHLIRTLHDLKTIYEDSKARHAERTASGQRES